MTEEHTQEPIYLKEYIPFTYIMDKNHKRLLKVESKDDDLLKRIVSCVNALAGIDDPESLMSLIHEMLENHADKAHLTNYALFMHYLRDIVNEQQNAQTDK